MSKPHSQICVRSNGSKAGDDFVALYNKTSQQFASKEREWIHELREQGVKASHPDDGWVNREENYVQFSYPQFYENPKVGDKIALGRHEKYRIVKITKIEGAKFMGLLDKYFFELLTSES